ncbi:hypothetical protein B0O99DRAFT_197248 [Bisporella sp. PMI_857]|nr:hypothetical protein B0O99DRAFT_197248 [Bisporella sp. PMI_857]
MITIDEKYVRDHADPEGQARRRVQQWHLKKTPVAARISKIIMFIATFIILAWQFGYSNIFAQSPRPILTSIPPYVLKYAPLVWLDEEERYFPSDIYEQVNNTLPQVNHTEIENPPSPLTLDNLGILNNFGDKGLNVFLTSAVDVETHPSWLEGIVPDSNGRTDGAISCVIVINDHGDGVVDAFYMYFYAFNRGNTVLGQELGDHIGDWEHNMVRFENGKPQALWFSQHGYGDAYEYTSVEKIGVRPISYSARGSHANYATAGTHDHLVPIAHLPFGVLQDYTSQGTLWDPILSTYIYGYDGVNKAFYPLDEDSPMGAMNFRGKWGDQQYPDSDPRQKEFFGFRKYENGPTGPWRKQLERKEVCPANLIKCYVRKLVLAP